MGLRPRGRIGGETAGRDGRDACLDRNLDSQARAA